MSDNPNTEKGRRPDETQARNYSSEDGGGQYSRQNREGGRYQQQGYNGGQYQQGYNGGRYQQAYNGGQYQQAYNGSRYQQQGYSGGQYQQGYNGGQYQQQGYGGGQYQQGYGGGQYQQQGYGGSQYGQQGYNSQQQYYQQAGYQNRQNYQQNGNGDQYSSQGYNGGPQYGQQPGSGKKPGKKRKKGLFILELIILLILALGVFVFVRIGRMDRMSLKDILTNEGVASQSGYQNFVIYGVDSREGELTKDSHSDTIIICSMNKKTKEIKMVSVYRDTYLDNTNGEYRKATECYYFGGPERSINMLNKNLDLDIQDYITVNFNAVVEAVDLIGGIDIDITEEELQWLNGYQVENSQVTGAAYEPVPAAGYQHLNGNQTLAYCRIRYTEGYDFKRTERQRLVLEKIFEKAKSQGVTTLISLMDQMLPSISTSFSNTELIGLISGIGGYRLGETAGFPFEQTPANISAGDCVVPVNLAQNVTELHAFLFGEDGYTPSQTVQDISNEIIYTTGIQ